MGKCVILDYGLVLCHAPEEREIKKISEIFGIDPSTFWTRYERDRGLYDRGDLSAEEYWQKFGQGARAKLEAGEIEWLRKCDIEMWSRLKKPLLDWVGDLGAAGYKTGILSNLNKEFALHMRTKCDWLKRFDVQVFSSEVGMIKPDATIYRHCLQLLRAEPSEALFVDDREANIVAARREGITSVHFLSTEQLRTELEGLGFEVLPPVKGALTSSGIAEN